MLLVIGGSVLVLCLCLIAVFGALVYSDKFRSDMLAGDGSAEFLGMVSVQGAIMVLITGMLLAGIVGLVKYGLSVDAASETDPVGVITNPTTAERGDGGSEVREPAGADTVAMVRSLRWAGETSRAIRAMAEEPEGPWKPDTPSHPVDVSVEVEGVVGLWSCTTFRGERVRKGDRFELRSMARGRPGPAVVGTVSAFITLSDECPGGYYDHELMLSCDLSSQVFSDEVFSCRDGRPRPLGGYTNPLPVLATFLGAPTDSSSVDATDEG